MQGGAKVGLELWVRDTKFIVVLFNNYDIIFHVNNCKAAFAASCVSFPILSLLILCHPVLGNWHFLPVCVFSFDCLNKFFFRVVFHFTQYILFMCFFIKLCVHKYTWFLAILVEMDHWKSNLQMRGGVCLRSEAGLGWRWEGATDVGGAEWEANLGWGAWGAGRSGGEMSNHTGWRLGAAGCCWSLVTVIPRCCSQPNVMQATQSRDRSWAA